MQFLVMGRPLAGTTPARLASDMNDSASLRALLQTLPAVVLGLYAWFIAKAYVPHLDWHLKFHKPALGFSPEDVLGIGFLLPWLFFLLFFVFALAAGLVVTQRKMRFFVLFTGCFGALSVTDLFLYRVLERQVLAVM